jgi:hypothetical protein
MDADREWPLALGENGRSGGQGGRGRGSIRGAGLGGSSECKRARVWLSLIYILRFRPQRGPSDNLYGDLQGEEGQSAKIMTQAPDFPKWKRGSSSSASCSNPFLDSIHLPVPNLPQHLRSTNMASLVASRLRTAAFKSRTCSQLRYFSSSLTRLQNDAATEAPPKPPKPIDDSTSALDYKNSHRVHPPPLPSMDLPRARTAEEAVTNILYNTPPPSLQPFKT